MPIIFLISKTPKNQATIVIKKMPLDRKKTEKEILSKLYYARQNFNQLFLQKY